MIKLFYVISLVAVAYIQAVYQSEEFQYAGVSAEQVYIITNNISR